MSSFTNIITNIVTTLKNDTALSSFCNEKWDKSLTVLPVYKNRVEINKSDLPVILITRPTNKKSFIVGGRSYEHTVRLYCGFHQTDRSKALNEIIGFDEAIETALLADRNRGGYAIDTDPQDTANDEGPIHESYFLVMDVIILTET